MKARAIGQILMVIICGIALAEGAAAVLSLAPVPPVPIHSPQSRVTLAWDIEGGVAGYNVYQGPAPRTYTNMISAGNCTTITVIVPRSANYFAATAYNASGIESDFSDEVAWSPPPPPAPPNVVTCVWGPPVDVCDGLMGQWIRTLPLIWCGTNSPEPVKLFRGYGLTITRTNQ